MPFELLKGIGKDYAYNPILHGFSKREIKDTLRRMEVLMKDLDELTKRKEKEKKRLEGLIPVVNWIGRDVNKEKIHEAYDHACWAAMDKAGIEFELPVIERALENAPEETPPLRHEDYYQRCKNLQARRGEYWRINPTFRDFYSKEGAAGIGLPTPEKDTYWPTQQVPWQQGAPSPPLLPPTPPPPSPPITSDPWYQRPWRTPPKLPPVSTIDLPTTPRRKPQRPMPPRRPNIAPSRHSSRFALPEGLRASFTSSSSSEILNSDPPLTSFPLPGGSYYHTSPSVPKSGCPSTPWSSPEVEFTSPIIIPKPMLERFSWLQNSTDDMDEPHNGKSTSPQAYVTPSVTQTGSPSTSSSSPELDFSSPLYMGNAVDERDRDLANLADVMDEVDALNVQLMKIQSLVHSDNEEDPCSLQDSPLQLITDKEFETVGDENFLTPQEQQQDYSAELLDPEHLGQAAFSPEVLDDAAIQRMLCLPQKTSLPLSPEAQQGLRLMESEPTDQEAPSRFGYMREERWKERLGRWKTQEERQREEERLRGQCAQERQMDAESVFGIHTRDIRTPTRDARTPPRLLPETLPWGESPVDHISPPHPTMAWQRPLPPIAGRPLPKHMRKQVVYRPVLKHRPLEKSIKHTGKGKRLVRPKPSHVPRSHIYISERPPSRLLYPKTKGGPTTSQPDRPSTSQCIYNTRRGQYEHLDSWERSPENYSKFEKDHYFDLHRQRYEEMLKPGPGVVPPVPAPPPPLPPPEYGPEPECLSVYVPESVDESPDTLIQRINESVARFDYKMDLVRQKLESRTRFRSQSKWVSEEYTSDARREADRKNQQEKEIRNEIEKRKKWENFMLGKFGCVPSADRYGRMRGIRTRTASSYRPPVPEILPPRRKAPVVKPYGEPLHGPWLPKVYGSTRPPPRTAAGRIRSPCEHLPKPAVRKPEKAPTRSYTTRRIPNPQAQPAQVQYGSVRAPPKTASSYKYQPTPKCRPASNRAVPRQRPVPSASEILYGSVRAPPRTAACARPQTPTGQP